MAKKIKKQHTDYSCGFAVTLKNVPMIQVGKEWVVDISYNELLRSVALTLAFKATPLTGDEIRFVRQYFEMTYRDFALRFGVAHPTVIKWEKKADQEATITWGIEKDIRLFVLDNLCRKSTAFRDAYRHLEDIHLGFAEQKKATRIKLDLKHDFPMAC